MGNKDQRDTVHVERVTRKEAPDTPWLPVGGRSSGAGGGGASLDLEPGEAPPHVGAMLHKPARVLRSMWKSHLLSMDRWSPVLPIRVSCWPSVPPLSILSSP